MPKHPPHSEGGALRQEAQWYPPPIRRLVSPADFDALIALIKEDIAASHRDMMGDLQNRIVALYATIIHRLAQYAE
jgi:hypothetical protein